MKYRLKLDYTIPSGDLTPYFNALLEGRALASTCTTCGYVAFPARTTCQRCAGRQIDWTGLPGTATLLYRSDGPTGSFALVRFEGADTNSTVALANPEVCNPHVQKELNALEEQDEHNVEDAQAIHQSPSLPDAGTLPDAGALHGRLIVPPGDQPGLWVTLTTNNNEIDDEH